MTTLYSSVTSCFNKQTNNDRKVTAQDNEPVTSEVHSQIDDNAQKPETVPQKVSSGVYSLGSGALWYGVGGVKWAASTTYNVGAGLVTASKNVISKARVKPKAD